jgi:hypothetical protein
MKRTWTIIGVGDVLRSVKGTRRCSVNRLPFLPMITLGKSGTQWDCLALPPQMGAHEHPPLMRPDLGTLGNGLLLFVRVDDFDLALQRHALSSVGSSGTQT